MSERCAVHIYYSEVERLILECVDPFFRQTDNKLERRSWRRHYAGGAHLRVELRAGPTLVNRVADDLCSTAERYLLAHPSAANLSYSPIQAAALLLAEGEDSEKDELEYKNNIVVRVPYRSHRYNYVSEEAALLAEDFRHDTMDLAVAILGDKQAKRAVILRLYFLNALVIGEGDLMNAAVSYKSHWEGFAVASDERVVRRIQASYVDQKSVVAAILADVLRLWETEEIATDPVLGRWADIIRRYARRSYDILESGIQLTPQAASLDEVRRTRERVWASMKRESTFVRRLWEDERFLASVQYDIAFLTGRVITNLLYTLLASVGLHAVDKMALCYYAHQSIEQLLGKSLDDLLEQNIRALILANAHRCVEPAT